MSKLLTLRLSEADGYGHQTVEAGYRTQDRQ